ncbi:NAD(P)-dependent oxidoreductase [Lishizhenia sp.]|uniref:NAD-dependent epimerase/dehydratase family protein n=1 Tax=Lishizhenia sp. TaxID=2497594 RepID=UPI00299DF146|nr:NAD(P)-dependent oxidoreductase [Lishizhenia sp.]MDX1446351.1 NAD(P)-dependent oxidoreductase [Lishizhenia sp.]
MRIIITGATGAFGGAMVRYFVAKGHEVIATGRDNNPPKELLKLAKYIQADICTPYELPEADICIHSAAYSDDKAPLKSLYTPNVVGTRNTLKAAQNCDKFIYISSSSVYLPDSLPIQEEMAGNQNNKLLSSYGQSKLLAEEVIENEFQKEQCFILRPRAFYGVGDTQIIPRILKLVKNNQFSRPGKMDIKVSMTHYDNMAKAIELCMASSLTGIRTYNIADDDEYILIENVRKLIKALYPQKISEKEISILLLKVLAFFKIGGFTPLLVRGLTQNMVLDLSKIKRELGYTSAITFDDTLKDLSQWVEAIGGVKHLQAKEKLRLWGKEFY